MVKRVYIAHGKAISLRVVADQIAKVLEANDMICEVTNEFNVLSFRRLRYTGIIMVYPCDPVFASEFLGYYTIFKHAFGDRLIWYTTVEGYPHRVLASRPAWKYVEFVANSKFTMRMLSRVGLNVVDVVYHGIDPDEVRRAKLIGEDLRRKVKTDFKDKVVFGVVSSAHFRKGMDHLLHAISLLDDDVRSRTVFLIISEPKIMSLLNQYSNIDNVFFVDEMGRRTHEEILGFMYACDYTVFPSMCEGFGLPVLESMAMGRPVIHCWFPPLSEFSSQEYNITFPYTRVQEVYPTETGTGGIVFTLHRYRPEDLAKAITTAVKIYLDNPSRYTLMCEKVQEIAMKYNIYELYRKFVDKMAKY